MKKLLILFALGVSLCANAQLTVFENGKVQMGNMSSDLVSSKCDLTICKVNDNTSIPISPSVQAIQSTGSIAFGASARAYISGGGLNEALSFVSSNLIEMKVGLTESAVSLNGRSQSFTSKFDIKAPTFLTTSDSRLKKNVTSLNHYYEMLMDVNAVSYNLTQPSLSEDGIMALKESAEESTTIEDERTHFGFIAQEIQKIYPNLVVEDEEGMLAIDYTGFIPLLVEAYKDLTGKVKEQEEVIDALLSQKGPSYMPASVNGLADSKATLKQNKPNPFNTTTTIECSVPQSVASAFICVYDLQGKQVHRIDIRERGDIANVIDASYFAPGMYIYALIADGTEIDSKRMIITD